MLKEAGITPSQLSAVSVSKGPGSYTGLRIGVSTAKGLCYALNIPLIAIDSLFAMCYGAKQEAKALAGDSNFLLCPMIDARRMEVYCAFYDEALTQKEPVKAVVVDSTSFESILEKEKVIFFGNGAAKCKEAITQPNALFFGGNYV